MAADIHPSSVVAPGTTVMGQSLETPQPVSVAMTALTAASTEGSVSE